jgi:hypothetical protein
VDDADLTAWRASLGVNAGADADNDGDSDGADFLAWQQSRGSGGTFIIQSRELVGVSSPNSQNQFGNDLALRDSDFYFAWIDFTDPLSPPIIAGDAVPEPGSLALVLTAVGALAAVRKRIG